MYNDGTSVKIVLMPSFRANVWSIIYETEIQSVEQIHKISNTMFGQWLFPQSGNCHQHLYII